MLAFRVDREAQNDLQELSITDPLVVTRFKAFLEQAECDPSLLHALMTHSFNSPDIDIKKWIRQHNQGQAIWRLRFCCFTKREPDYRIFYCIEKQIKRKAIVYILGVKRREDIDYDDDNHPTSRSIIDAFAKYSSRIHM